MTRNARFVVRLWISLIMLVSGAWSASAQTPAAPQAGQPAAPRPDDTPSVRIGGVLFTDFTYTRSPQATDADSNTYHPSQFNVGRSYINITGNLNHIVNFRLTPDISRESGAGSSLNGSLTFRVKYAFGQVNLDDWMAHGSWVRFGIQQTPWVDFQEGIYRYRFQGTVFSEREGYLSSSDAGVSFRYNMPSNYGEIHVGVYNGENYNRAEVNGQKALQVRGSVRPLASGAPVLRGLRVHGFYDADNYVRNGERRRADVGATFEHARLNAGIEYLDTRDRPTIARTAVSGHGFSMWATPRAKNGWEALLRYDHMTPDTSVSNQTRTRTILGAAYWFPHQGPVTSALLVDYDGQTFHNFVTAQPKQQRIAVHALVNF
ncbi:MAG: hypothetical protein JSU08_08110 [Acidobacteria bacterium]|nr:hypothetical protein [Acidobacteriota bacterium]